jgi:hypothetical protein
MRRTSAQILIGNLEQKISSKNAKIYSTKERAYEELKRRTDQDFGYDVDAWIKWLREHGEEIPGFPLGKWRD